jgi:hypothetical protein
MIEANVCNSGNYEFGGLAGPPKRMVPNERHLISCEHTILVGIERFSRTTSAQTQTEDPRIDDSAAEPGRVPSESKCVRLGCKLNHPNVSVH